jgi:ribosomal protein S3
VELRLIRLNHSALDSSIFAQYLTANGGKYSFNRILDMLKGRLPTVVSEGSVTDTSVASHITGVKIQLSGRLTTQRSSPRQTVQAGRLGSSAKGPYGLVDYSQHTSKNKLGAFTMKV